MTLIAVRTGADFAEVLVDTLAYGPGDVEFVHTNKVRTFPHAAYVTTGKGSGSLSAFWGGTLDAHPRLGDNLDAVITSTPKELRALWDVLDDDQKTGRAATSWIYMVGWSDKHARFVAYEHNSDRDFEPVEVGRSSAFANPAPTTALPEPTSDADWFSFAEAVYEEHATTLDLRYKNMIGGALWLTRITRDLITQQRIGVLPEGDRRHRQMLIGTVHPIGQMGPCPCGSGQPYLVCHLPTFDPDWLCPCESGKTFVDCGHRLTPASRAVFDHWNAHADDFHRTKDELRANWQREFPYEPRMDPPQIIRPVVAGPALPAPMQNRAARRAAAKSSRA